MTNINVKKTIPKVVIEAWKLAKKTRLNAYVPYSQFLVGSALKFCKDKTIYTGCNFENASYGATICAERNALGAAIAHGVIRGALKNSQKFQSVRKKDLLEFVVVVTNTTHATPPCGMCLQVLNEFAGPNTMVYLATNTTILQKAKFHQFLPTPFNEIEVL